MGVGAPVLLSLIMLPRDAKSRGKKEGGTGDSQIKESPGKGKPSEEEKPESRQEAIQRFMDVRLRFEGDYREERGPPPRKTRME